MVSLPALEGYIWLKNGMNNAMFTSCLVPKRQHTLIFKGGLVGVVVVDARSFLLRLNIIYREQ